jgi:hypothetical protein
MKSIVIVLALIVAVSCDVSEIVGQGWSKDASGYKYPQPPAVKFDEAVAADVPAVDYPQEALPEEPVIPEIQYVEAGCVNGGSGPYCCINGADNEGCLLAEEVSYDIPAEVAYDAPVEAPVEVAAEEPVYDFVGEVDARVEEPSNDYLPPVNNEYLPPALRKRAIQNGQVKRQAAPARRVQVQAKRQVQARRPVVQAKRQVPAQARRPVVQVKRQAPAQARRPVVQVKRQTQVKRQVPVRRTL